MKSAMVIAAAHYMAPFLSRLLHIEPVDNKIDSGEGIVISKALAAPETPIGEDFIHPEF